MERHHQGNRGDASQGINPLTGKGKVIETVVVPDSKRVRGEEIKQYYQAECDQ